MDFSEFQRCALDTDLLRDAPEPIVPLLGLAGEAGSLATEYKKRLRDGQLDPDFAERAVEELGDILWYTAALASHLDLDLDSIAEKNLAKTKDRWGTTEPEELLDANFPAEEQFPRRFQVTFKEFEKEGLLHVAMYMGDEVVGDPLSDNALEDDGYRFHDAFHIALASTLGWSPLFRSLLHRKRKSDPMIDLVEDGGRAVAIEEGLSAYVFTVAGSERFFKDQQHVSTQVLQTVRAMTISLEVSKYSLSRWEAAILAAYDVWRQLLQKRGGTVEGNLEERSFRYVGPPA